MISRSLLLTFPVVAMVSIASAADKDGYTTVNLSEQSKDCASAAGNDLGNEIILRINAKQDPELKKLLATDELAEQLRQKCKDAIAKVLEQETDLVSWRTKPVEAGAKKQIREEKELAFVIDLGSGLKWDQKVKLSWDLSQVTVDHLKKPVRSMIWISFALPTLPALGGGDMSIGGGCSLRTDFIAFN